ncbi:N-alpha-acetyltransferase 50 [Quaeritorhiza haematococci]|nr:N-alpha-acetyltransferase 50 [Quaeritorhiza haematococci]
MYSSFVRSALRQRLHTIRPVRAQDPKYPTAPTPSASASASPSKSAFLSKAKHPTNSPTGDTHSTQQPVNPEEQTAKAEERVQEDVEEDVEEEEEETEPPRTWIQIKLVETDLHEKFIKGGGPGGQKINKSSSCVQLTHIPTGIVVECQRFRDLASNRKHARTLLLSKLDDHYNGELSKRSVKAKKIRDKKAKKKAKTKKRLAELKKRKEEELGTTGSGDGGDAGVVAQGTDGEAVGSSVKGLPETFRFNTAPDSSSSTPTKAPDSSALGTARHQPYFSSQFHQQSASYAASQQRQAGPWTSNTEILTTPTARKKTALSNPFTSSSLFRRRSGTQTRRVGGVQSKEAKCSTGRATSTSLINTNLASGDLEETSRVLLLPVTNDNVDFLKRLNASLFPVHYNNKFYQDVLTVHPKQLSRLAYFDNECVGGICCRKEALTVPGGGDRVSRVYIMTLGVLAPYRRLRIGSLLLSSIEAYCETDKSINHLCLHVQTSNEEAIRFYTHQGFDIAQRVDGYYRKNRGVEPPDALLLKKLLHRS